MYEIIKRFSWRNYSWKHVTTDVVLMLISLYFSLWLRLGDARMDQHLPTLNALASGFVGIRVFTFIAFGIYQSLWRYISAQDASRLATAVVFSVPLLISFTYAFPQLGYLPRSLFIIDAFVCTALLMGIRLARRRLFEHEMKGQKDQVRLGKLLIYGAGLNGRLLAQRLSNDPARQEDLLGFLDDDPVMRTKRIQGLPVLGGFEDIANIMSQSQCTDLVVAITHPPAHLMREIVILGRKHDVRIHRVAHFNTQNLSMKGEALYQQIELKDLLNRPATEIDIPSISSLIENKVVLVTGAGGSIGSELSRQIARFKPGKLLLLDHSEFNLFEIDRELRPDSQSYKHVIPLLVDIKSDGALEQVFTQHHPDLVFHAAAYKHVHLVEANVHSAILNNVQGTWNLLNLCEQYPVERFVMVSTDKAVNPVGAMGATKRACEILTTLTGLKTRKPFSSVRFGNVLGSSGSLIPLLRKQIEDGGPVTLTHPEMTRYFMLIPEAVSLILMSATISQPGDINVLKMGEPIRILDLARSLMALMGKNEEEIGIAFTGVRPGEKMYEELYLTGDELTTRHPDILTVPQKNNENEKLQILQTHLQRLVLMAQRNDPSVTNLLRQIANDVEVSESLVSH